MKQEHVSGLTVKMGVASGNEDSQYYSVVQNSFLQKEKKSMKQCFCSFETKLMIKFSVTVKHEVMSEAT